MAEASKLHAALDVLSGRIDQAIQHACPALVEGSEQSQFGSQRLSEAMRYSLLTPGKRIRPLLFLAAVDCLGNRAGVDEDKLAGFAAGIEMIHAYSLIHDDLPAMDDDDLRRGRPTNHKVYGEGMAILAGDALLTEAFERMCRPLTDPTVQLAVIGEVAAAAGAMGMVGGQAADMLAEGVEPEQGVLRSIHRRKTGCLIACSVTGGARMAGADAEELSALREFGDRFGLAFQIADDIKDEVLPVSVTGKTGGGDTAAAKMTFPSIHGIEGARSLCRSELAAADQALAALDGRGALLGYLASQSVLPALGDDPAQA